MSIGENIYNLRKEKGMSQGELAELLEVSRQSVSKWETDAAVPEVDKLVRISEIFGITLDELIKGKTDAKESAKPSEGLPTPKAGESSANGNCVVINGIQPRKITGTVLFCFAALFFLVFTVFDGLAAGLLFAAPFALCGAVCFIFKKRIALWCCWVLYFAVDVYMSYGTALNRANILRTFSWTADMNYMILILSWVSFLLLLALMAATAISLRKSVYPKRQNAVIAGICAAIIVLSKLLDYVLINWYIGIQTDSEMPYSVFRNFLQIFRVCNFTLGWITIVAATILIVCGWHLLTDYIKSRKQSNG